MDLKALLPVVIQISLILIVASIGLQSGWRDLLYASKRPGLQLRGFAAVYVVVPAVAIVLALLLPLEPLVRIGIVAMAVSPLAPFVPGKMLKAGSDTPFVVGVYVGLLILAVLIIPATLALLTTISPRAVVVGPGPIAWLILTSVLLPLAGGLAIAGLAPSLAPKIARIASLIGNIALLILLIPILFVARHQIGALIGNGAVVAIVAITLAGLAAGHWLGGRDPHHRVALAQAAATRHPGIAVLLVRNTVDDQRAVVAVLLFLLVSIVVSALYGKWAGRWLSSVPHGNAPGVAA